MQIGAHSGSWAHRRCPTRCQAAHNCGRLPRPQPRLRHAPSPCRHPGDKGGCIGKIQGASGEAGLLVKWQHEKTHRTPPALAAHSRAQRRRQRRGALG